jgi:hypothetical protein
MATVTRTKSEKVLLGYMLVGSGLGSYGFLLRDFGGRVCIAKCSRRSCGAVWELSWWRDRSRTRSVSTVACQQITD